MHQMIVHEVFIGCDISVIIDLHRFPMPTLLTRHITIGRVHHRAPRIPRNHLSHARCFLEITFCAPETPAGEICSLVLCQFFRCLFHMFFFIMFQTALFGNARNFHISYDLNTTRIPYSSNDNTYPRYHKYYFL